MAYPVPIVEIAFSDGPYVVSPTWTDVTAYVTDLSTSRGRDDDWGQFTGTAQVTLLNRDRRFDPFYTSGPYYGNLKPRRQIRIRSTWNGNTYDVFRGFIQGWPPAWTDAGKMSTVTLSCFDALDLLGSNTMPVDWAQSYISSLNPYHYWLLNDPIIPFGATVATDNGSNQMPLVLNSTCQMSGGMAEGLVNQSLNVSGNRFVYTNPSVNVIPSYSFTVTTWMNQGSDESIGSGGVLLTTLGYVVATYIFNGYLYVSVTQAGVTSPTRYQAVSTSQSFAVSQNYFIAVQWDWTYSAIYVFVNGQPISVTQTSGAGTFSPNREYVSLSPGQYQQLAVFNYLLTVAQVQEIFNRSQALFSETTSARINRIVGQTPYSASLVSTPASPVSDVMRIGTNAPPASRELQRAADAEYSPLFVSKSGVLTLFQQNQIRTQSSSITTQVVYGFMGANIGTQINLQYDGDSVRNIANVGVTGGGVVTVKNSTSVSAVGQAEQSIDTDIANLEDATQVGNIISGWGGQVYAAADEFEVVLSPNNSWGETLGLELCDRFTLSVLPPTGNVISVPMLLNRVRHEVQPGRWRTFVTGSARWAAAFILNQSVLDGTDLLG